MVFTVLSLLAGQLVADPDTGIEDIAQDGYMVGQRQAFKRTAGFGEHHSQDLPARFLPIFLLSLVFIH